MRFVLVHGAFHGAWCWERLIPELERLGETALAIDLPGHGERANETASLSGYRDAILDVLEPDDVLVGHSLGSLAITATADAAADRVRHLVYLTTVLPTEGKAWSPLSRLGPGLAKAAIAAGGAITRFLPQGWLPFRVDEDGGAKIVLTSEEKATTLYYQDCSPELAHWAFSKLTPQPLLPTLEPVSAPRFWKAQLPRSLIMARQDRVIKSARMIERTIKRLGVDPLWIDSSHFPILSQPSVCAELIVQSVNRPPVGPLMSH